MTRETRIGLLVGLLFIIMFGMVLSELTGMSTKKAPPNDVAINTSGPSLLQNYTTPLMQAEPMQGKLAAVQNPFEVEPAAKQELESVVEASLSSPASGAGGEVASALHPQTERTDTVMPVAEVASIETISEAPQSQVYVVQANDSLIKIARKVYGTDNETQYMRIYKANKETLADVSSLKVGQKLVIPAIESKPAVAAEQGPASPQIAKAKQQDIPHQESDIQELTKRFTPNATQTQKTSVGTTYVVKQGDTLTKIARRTLNDSSRSAIDKIIEANREHLKNPNALVVGMKLEIPS